MPANHKATEPEVINTKDAEAKSHENFREDMEATGMVATDGAGGKVAQRSKRHRAVGAGAAVVTFDENREPVRGAAGGQGPRETDGAKSRGMGSKRSSADTQG